MEPIETASTTSSRKVDTCLLRTEQALALSAHTRRIHRLMGALQSLDDRTLSQLGIERDEIERFAHAEVAHIL
jgi:uncharacterized protein YjiS (DUF1127 family)